MVIKVTPACRRSLVLYKRTQFVKYEKAPFERKFFSSFCLCRLAARSFCSTNVIWPR